MTQVPPLSGTSRVMEDEATRQKVTDIINHQFDLEILLRHAEGAAISKELAKAERMLEDLRHAILSGKPAFLKRSIQDHTQRRNPQP